MSRHLRRPGQCHDSVHFHVSQGLTCSSAFVTVCDRNVKDGQAVAQAAGKCVHSSKGLDTPTFATDHEAQERTIRQV